MYVVFVLGIMILWFFLNVFVVVVCVLCVVFFKSVVKVRMLKATANADEVRAIAVDVDGILDWILCLMDDLERCVEKVWLFVEWCEWFDIDFILCMLKLYFKIIKRYYSYAFYMTGKG